MSKWTHKMLDLTRLPGRSWSAGKVICTGLYEPVVFEAELRADRLRRQGAEDVRVTVQNRKGGIVFEAHVNVAMPDGSISNGNKVWVKGPPYLGRKAQEAVSEQVREGEKASRSPIMQVGIMDAKDGEHMKELPKAVVTFADEEERKLFLSLVKEAQDGHRLEPRNQLRGLSLGLLRDRAARIVKVEVVA